MSFALVRPWFNGFDDGLDQPLALDAEGNVTVTGRSEGLIGANEGFSDYLTLQYDPAGTMRWMARYNGPGNREDWPEALIIDSNNHVILTGRSSLFVAEDGAAGLTWVVNTTLKYTPTPAVAVEPFEGPAYAAVLLQPNYPNPFSDVTTVSFTLDTPTSVTLDVFDVYGRVVATLASQRYPAGTHAFAWDAAGMANGVYFYRLRTPRQQLVRSMVIVK